MPSTRYFWRESRQCVGTSLLTLLLLVACGGEQPAEADEAAQAEPESHDVADALPERDISGIDVCAALPAEVLAEATGMPVAEAPWRMDHDPSPNCTYRLRGSSGSGERIDVILMEPFDYDWARQTAVSFDREVIDIDNLGIAAYHKKSLDGWSEVWAARADGLIVHTTGNELEPTIAAARVALERLP